MFSFSYEKKTAGRKEKNETKREEIHRILIIYNRKLDRKSDVGQVLSFPEQYLKQNMCILVFL